MRILLEAPILTQSGYGEHSRLVMAALMQQEGLEIFLNPLEWGQTSWASSLDQEMQSEIDTSINKLQKYIEQVNQTKQQMVFDVQIHVGIPSEFQKKAPVSICVTAGIETDRVSHSWILKTHQGINKLIVPSEHAKQGFVNTSYEVSKESTGQKTILGCNCPIDVVPYPVKNVEPKDLDFKTTTSFNFLSVALLGPRKNIQNMITWFVEEFKEEDVGLILKTGRSKGGPIDEEATLSHLRKILQDHKERKCKVYLLHGDLEESEIQSLYLREDVHAYLSATHGEGYGLPVFEAAYSGLPIVATDWSAHTEFLSAPIKEGGKVKNKKLFAKVNYDLGPIPREVVWKDILIEGSQWAYPNEKSFKEQMRKVYKNYGMYKKWSISLMKQVTENYTRKNIVDLMKNKIFSIKDEVAPRPVNGISFCISTNASKPDKTLLEVKSIKKAMSKVNIPYEIVVAGVTDPFSSVEGLTLVSTPEDANTGLLAKLRNNAAEVSKYDNLVFVDDDFIFEDTWAEQLLKFSENNGWQVLGNKILLPDGSRFWDRCTMVPHKLVDYDHPDICNQIYQTGGFWIMRRETYLEHKWNSDIPINAAERGLAPYNEDIDMTMRIHNAGIKFCFDKENLVWHNDDSYMEFNEQTLKREVVNEHFGIEAPSEIFVHPSFAEVLQKCS